MELEGGGDPNTTPLVTWKGKDYPLGGFTVLQVLQFSNRLHIENPRPTQERKNYMERVVRFLGNMLLKCQNRTLTNLVLHDLSAVDITRIYMARSIPCLRQHTYNFMVETEYAIWESSCLTYSRIARRPQPYSNTGAPAGATETATKFKCAAA